MDSLILLCARCVIVQSPRPTIPAHLYPVLFQVAFLDGRSLVLQDLVATWPFPELHFQRLVGHQELFRVRGRKTCIRAVIQGVVSQLQRELKEPGSDSSESQLRLLDMTGVWDDTLWSMFCCLTQALAKACLEVSKHQQELQRHQSKQRKGYFGATMATPQLPGVDVLTDLLVQRSSYENLHHALQTRAASLLRIKCREFQARGLSASETVTLLKSLDPSCLQRVHLQFVRFGLKELLEIMPHLSRFPELRSLMIQLIQMGLWRLTPRRAMRIRDVARQLGMLPRLRELNLGMTELSGNLHQFLCNLQAPLESLALHRCSLVPADLAFLSQSFHAPALKRLDLSGHDISQGLLEPLRLLLEETSASLLYLDLSYCHMADSHLAVLLPTLLRCSRLRFLRLDGNHLSMAALKDLLQKTLELPGLQQVVYPTPGYSRRLEPWDFRWNFVLDNERLEAAEEEFSQILANSGRTDFIWNSSFSGNRGLDYFSLCFRKS